MAYLVLTQDEQDDITVSTQLAQERDHFCHTTNLERFTAMLPTLPAGEWKTRITQLKTETEKRLNEVNSILVQTTSKMPDKARTDAALARLAAAAAAAKTV